MGRDYNDAYVTWLYSGLLNEEEKKELLSIKDDEKAKEERFYQDLAFGTAGLRGVMEVGTNRMNRFVIRRATQGFANYLNKHIKNPTIAIGYDSRNNSAFYSQIAAMVLAANNIKVYLYKELMPTPALSFAVRHLKCDAGIVVTASHNPAKYNGYKVYGNDGCQCGPEMADAILEEINALDYFADLKIEDFNEALAAEKIVYIEDDVFDAYMQSTIKQSIYKEPKNIKIIYTPLYGAGRKCITSILALDGFNNVNVVKEQEMPNGNFPTCPYPNPEMKEALKLGIEQLLQQNADILIASDPDSDRVGVVVNQNGNPIILTGNEVGIVLFDAIYHARLASHSLGKDPYVVKTIVTSDLINIMANAWDISLREVLTGFKFICGEILKEEEANSGATYLLGFEESCGYLTNTDVRDKDAVNACLLIAEIANHYKKEGKSLYDRLVELYDEFGHFKNRTLVFEYPGVEGAQKMKNIMKMIRTPEVKEKLPPVDHIGDYLKGTITYDNKVEPTGLPPSDVVKFFLKSKETITVRPSGTEPKLKVYVFANGDKNLEQLVSTIESILK